MQILLVALLTVPAPPSGPPTGDGPDSGWVRVVQPASPAASAQPPGGVEDRALAATFALPSGESLSPWVPAAGLSAVYLGRVSVESAGRYRLGLEVAGAERALLVAAGPDGALVTSAAEDGRAFTEWARLDGEIPVLVAFRRDGERPARLVTLWERSLDDDRGFRPEPVPAVAVSPLAPADLPPALRQEASGFSLDPSTAVSSAVRAGRVRFGELGCAHCHAVEATLPPPSRRGPDLTGVAERVSIDWLRTFVRDPQDSHPGGGMPDVFGHEDADFADAEALVHYLVGERSEEPSGSVATEESVLAAGRRLYHTVGCVACHGPRSSPAEAHATDLLPAEVPRARVPHLLAGLARKWKPAALAAYLADPSSLRPEGRMPDLGLSAEEADEIAAFLLSQFGAAPAHEDFELDPELARRGAEVFEERGCHACHERPGERGGGFAAPFATPLASWQADQGCLSPEAVRTPRYRFRPGDAEALRAWVALHGALDEVAPAPLEAALDRIEDLSCRACHERDGWGGVEAPLRPYFVSLDEKSELGDEGRIPPRLTGVGAKLQTSWLVRVIGEGARARPYLGARMPRFSAPDAEVLARGLACLDGALPHTDAPAPPVTDELVLAGKELMGLSGMACISCHTVGDRPPAGTAGPDLTRFAERLRYAWFREYMYAPDRFKPGTRMPRFTTRGESAFPQLGGDAARQIDAMWAYFTLGEDLPVPDGVPVRGGLLLEPSDSPIVFRTFLESVGTRAICVGDPCGLHYAFDAGAVRLAEVWRGAFLDASANWTARGGGEATGRGPLVWRAPRVTPLLLAPEGAPPAAWPEASGREAGLAFGGYRLDPRGAPTFLYTLSVPADLEPPGAAGSAPPETKPNEATATTGAGGAGSEAGVRGAGEAPATVRLEETFFPYPRPGVLFARLLAADGIPEGAVLWIRADDELRPDRAVELTPLAGAELRRSESGAWWGLVPGAPGEPALVTLEVAE